MEICKECGKEFNSIRVLNKHIINVHDKQAYYDKWICLTPSKCSMCENDNIFSNLKRGYLNGCKTHIHILGYENRKKLMLKKYGVENQFQRPEVKNQIKKSIFKKYGVEHQMHVKEVKEKINKTCIEKYGVKSVFCRDSSIRINFENKLFLEEGITNVYQRECVKNKIKNTCNERYGVDNPLQDPSIYLKAFKTRLSVHTYKDTNLHYQGSYELDFLEKYYDKILLENGPSIKYDYEGANKIYHSDFYMRSKNLIIEIKSSWTLQLDLEIYKKKEYAIKNGFNYIMIINKNYKEFNEWIK